MGGALIAPALPFIREHFSAEPEADMLVRLILTSPGLAVALSAPFVGTLIERLGRKETLLAGLILYALSGTTGLYLESLVPLLACRILLGVSMAMIMTCATTLVADHYEGEARAKFMAMQSSSMALGGVVFLVAGGMLADLHWRAPFSVYGAALVVAILAGAALSGRSKQATHTQHAATPPAYPVRTVVAAALAAMITMSLFYLLPVQVPFIVKERLAGDATRAGLAVATSTLISALSSSQSPKVLARLGNAGALLFTFLLVGMGLVAVGLAQSWPPLLLGMCLVGLGGGQLMPNVNSWISQLVPPQRRPMLLGRATAAVFLGQFISPFIAIPFLRAGLGQRGVFLGGAGLAAICLVVFALLKPTLDADTRGV